MCYYVIALPGVASATHPRIMNKYEFYADQGDPRWSNISKEEALQWLDKAFPPPIATKPERLHQQTNLLE